MELLIVSDSHGRCDRVACAWERQIKRPDAVCFLGDGLRDAEYFEGWGVPVYTVRGNCDWSSHWQDEAGERFLFLEGHKLLLTHGHLHDVKSGLGRITSYAIANNVDIVLYGHTHVAQEYRIPAGEQIGDVVLSRPFYLFNPGSIGSDGSFGTLTLSEKNVLFSHGTV